MHEFMSLCLYDHLESLLMTGAQWEGIPKLLLYSSHQPAISTLPSKDGDCSNNWYLTGLHSKHGILLPLLFHCCFSYAPQGATYHLTLYCCLHSVVRFHILFIPTQCAAQALDYVPAIVDKAVTESHCKDDYITHCFLRHATYMVG